MIPNPTLCPANLRASIDAYVQQGLPVGGFLEAVLSNDLLEAVNRADGTSLSFLPHVVAYVYKHVPLKVWGSKKKVDAHLSHGRDLSAALNAMVPEGQPS